MTNDFTDSKSKILKASKILFAKNGFDGTSTREIVKDCRRKYFPYILLFWE